LVLLKEISGLPLLDNGQVKKPQTCARPKKWHSSAAVSSPRWSR